MNINFGEGKRMVLVNKLEIDVKSTFIFLREWY